MDTDGALLGVVLVVGPLDTLGADDGIVLGFWLIDGADEIDGALLGSSVVVGALDTLGLLDGAELFATSIVGTFDGDGRVLGNKDDGAVDGDVDTVGLPDGACVGAFDGASVSVVGADDMLGASEIDGRPLGWTDGIAVVVGEFDSTTLGNELGPELSTSRASRLGANDGVGVNASVGRDDGLAGRFVAVVGANDRDGTFEGPTLGRREGTFDGTLVGSADGAWLGA